MLCLRVDLGKSGVFTMCPYETFKRERRSSFDPIVISRHEGRRIPPTRRILLESRQSLRLGSLPRSVFLPDVTLRTST